jgi:hypothetical protein
MRKASYKLMAHLARAPGRLFNASATKGIRRLNKIWTAAPARSLKIRIMGYSKNSWKLCLRKTPRRP